jgi:MtrB/PioB family decaheme-associated outer membrane protein
VGVDKNRNSAKYEEYRHTPEEHPVLDELKIDLENKDKNYYIEFRAEDSLQDDQRYLLRLGKYGKYEVELEWDELPHVFSNSGRSLLVSQGNGVFTISDDIQSALQENPLQLQELLTGADPVRLRLGRDTGRFSFRYTPTPAWDLRMGYSVRSDNGRRPFGTAFFFTNIVEVLYPVDYLTHEVTSSLEYAKKNWSLRLAYTGSLFENDVNALVWDNPFRFDDAVFGPSRGRLDLYPDNQAHTISLNGALNLPLLSRLTGTISYGWMFQDDDFLPFTINRAVTAPVLPAQDLNGELNPFMMNFMLTSRPLNKLTLTGRYRFYDLNNDGRSLLFSDYVVTDFGLAGLARRNLLYTYSTQNTGLETTYRLTSWGALKFGWEWEKWVRKFREVRNSDEHRFGPSFDITATDWLLLRTSYTRSQRDAHDYNPLAVLASFPEGEAVQNARLITLRKFDQATRERDGVEFLAQFTPFDTLSFATSFSFGNDDFSRSEFGLLRDTYISPAVDVVYNPIPRLSLFANYTWEQYEYRQRSRERSVVGFIAVDDPANNWTAKGRDTINTIGAGAMLTLVPRKLEFSLDYGISGAFGRLEAGGANPNAADFPNVKNRFQQLEAVFHYHLRENITVRVGYRFERYDETDFATTSIVGGDNIQPFMGDIDTGATTSTFLGAFVPNYTAHTALASIRYEW